MVEGNTLEEKCETLQKFTPHANTKSDQNLLIRLKNDHN